VLANLLQNVIKYSPVGTQSESQLGSHNAANWSSRSTTRVQVSLWRTARAFSSDFFASNRSNSRKCLVAALGWQICQSIVLAHGGYMRVSVRRGDGARFSVSSRGQCARTRSSARALDRLTVRDGSVGVTFMVSNSGAVSGTYVVPVFVHQASVIGTILVVHHDPLVRAASHTRPGARRITATLFHFQSWSVARTDLVHTPRIGEQSEASWKSS